MASDVAMNPNSQASSMREAREDYESKKQELEHENQAKLQQLQRTFKSKQDELRETGEASVNHIRRDLDKRADSQRTQGEEKIEKEGEHLKTTYEHLKRHGQQQTEQIESSYRQRVEDVQQKIKEQDQAEVEAAKKIEQKSREFYVNLEKQKESAMANKDSEVRRVQAAGNIEIANRKLEISEKKRKLDETESHDLQRLQQANKQNLEQTLAASRERLEDQKKNSDRNFVEQRSRFNKSLNEMQQKFHDESTAEQRQGEERIGTIERDYDKKARDERDRGILTAKQVREQATTEINRLDRVGQSEINDRRDKFERETALQKQAYKNKMEDMQKSENETMLQDQKEFDQRRREIGDIERKTIKVQGDEFHDKFEKGELAYKQALDNQKQNFLKQIYKQKELFDNKSDLQMARAQDPFYQVRDLNTNIEDKAGAFVLKVKVPPHERDGVQVHIKDDHVILTTRREFAEKIEKENAKLSTSAFQTHRQEIDLGYPVVADQVSKHFDDDGNFVVTIPKKILSAKA